MSIHVVAIAFGLIVVAELPDKTMIATIVMSSRERPLAVWIGSATALVVHVALAVVAGGLLTLLPHRVLEGIVTALFAAGGLYLLLGSERRAESLGEKNADRAPLDRRAVVAAFGVIFLAEFGDLTQLLTANLVAHYREPLAVFIGASVGMIAVSGAGVRFGNRAGRAVPLQIIRKVAGLVLLGFAGYSAVSVAGV